MADKIQQNLYTLTGWLKTSINSKISINGDSYNSVAMEVTDIKKDERKTDERIASIMLIFWDKNFDSKTRETISKLNEGQVITVHGYLGGRENGLMRVIGIETEDTLTI